MGGLPKALGRRVRSAFVGVALLAGCGGPIRLDLSSREDGIKIVVLERDGRLEQAGLPVLIRRHRREAGGIIDAPIGSGSAYLVELPASVMSTELGPVALEQLRLVPSETETTEPTLVGSELTIGEPLTSPSFTGVSVSRIADDGALVDVGRDALAMSVARTIRTEPCPPPLEPLEPLLLDGESLWLSPFGQQGTDDDGQAVFRFGADHLLLARDSVLLVEDGRLPEPDSPPSTYVGRGTRPGWAIYGYDDLRPEGVLLAVHERGSSGLYFVDVQEGQLKLTLTSTLPFSPAGIAELDDRWWVSSRKGRVMSATRLEGPWVDERGQLSPSSLGGISSNGKELAVLGGGRAVVWDGGQWRELDLDGVAGVDVEARMLLHTTDGSLWIGTSEGFLFRWRDGALAALSAPLPPRMGECGVTANGLTNVRIAMRVVGLEEVDGHLLVLYHRCSALLSLRIEDLCPGVLTTRGREPTPSTYWNFGLNLDGERLFVTGEGGFVLQSLVRR